MSAIEILKDGFALVGFPTMVAGFVYVGKKLQILDDLVITIRKAKDNLKVVVDYLISRDNSFPCDKLANYSPVSLTENGRKYLSRLSFYKIFSENKYNFFRCIDEEMPTSKIEVEISAVKSVLLLFENEYFRTVKDYLYNHPEDNRNTFAKIAGVYVRDEYLKAHPEIK
jgi:hypothetical protein